MQSAVKSNFLSVNPAPPTAEKGKRYLKATTQKIACFLVELSGADINDLYETD